MQLSLSTALAFTLGVGSAYAEEPPKPEPKTQGFVEMQVASSDHGPTLTVDGFVQHQLSPRWGLSGFALVTEGWLQGYVGPTLRATKWFEPWVSVGFEHADKGDLLVRYAAGWWMGNDKVSHWVIVEANNDVFRGNLDGLWYDVNLVYKPLKWLGVGLKDRRTTGLGLQVRLKAGPLDVWAAWTPLDVEHIEWRFEKVVAGALVEF